MHDFFNRLGLRYPLIQAPMAGVQDAALAIAVGRAGALGSLPCAMLGIEALSAQLARLREAAGADGVFNLNFFCHRLPQPDLAQQRAWQELLAALQRSADVPAAAQPSQPSQPQRQPFSAAQAQCIAPFRPAVVSFHFGLPEPALLEQVKACGAQVLCSATTVREALWLQRHGADAVIAQGLEAGGHRGHFLDTDTRLQMGTMALVPQMVDAIALPVIAAGGIAGPREVRAALALGAAGVQVGSAYLLALEATTSDIHRQALAQAADNHTELTRAFTGGVARGLCNEAVRALRAHDAAIPAFPLAAPGLAPLRAGCEAQGSGACSPLWSGQNNRSLKALPATELTHWLGQGCTP